MAGSYSGKKKRKKKKKNPESITSGVFIPEYSICSVSIYYLFMLQLFVSLFESFAYLLGPVCVLS